MGILSKIFNLEVENENKEFTPNLKDTEYNNWLNFLECGGTSDEWEALKKENKWKFKKDTTAEWNRYQNEVKPISDAYYAVMNNLEELWKQMNKSKDYTGTVAEKIENLCLQDIELYKEMSLIDKKYKQEVVLNVPAFTRLAMLYERQKKYNEAINVCEDACDVGVDLSGRAESLRKKALK